MTTESRPAFYALAPGGWRDYITLLHPPYTLWHLSYVAIGSGLAPELHAIRLGAALAAFFLGMGVGAHALDELKGRPLQTRIPERVLVVLAIVSIAGAVAIGVGAALVWEPWLLVFVAFGGVIVVAYNLELLGARLHTDALFALSWGALPVLSAYLVNAGTIRLEAVLAAVFATLLGLVQRWLSTPVRMVRRRVSSVTGTIRFTDGATQQVTEETLMGVQERALRVLVLATTALGAALVVLRLA
jgi:hypothetical protein